MYKLRNAEIEARVVDEDDHVGCVFHDVFLAECHVAEYSPQVQQHGYKAHVGKLTVVLDPCAADCRHEVAAEEAEFRIAVLLL